MTRWEYKSIKVTVQSGPTLNTISLDETLNPLGEQGWEMVTAFDLTMGAMGSREVIAIFKRERDKPAA